MGAITEAIFSHAVALQQNSRLKNTIYAKGKDVFIMNIDNTVLLKFKLPAKEPAIKEIAFKADDYDSDDYSACDGKVIFAQVASGYSREKACAPPDMKFSAVEKIWAEHDFINKTPNKIQFTSEILPLLEENLSHTEIVIADKKLSVIQRDVYSGSVITINKKAEGLLAGFSDKILFDYGPIGIRTNDFMALFSFCDKIDFVFDKSNNNYFFINGDKFGMEGIISTCVYDELYEVTKSKGEDNGRQITKGRRSEQKTSAKIGNEPGKIENKRTRKRSRR